ncbi:hypothetical protein GWK47_001267 [Chionoecetes opilio]|uniref:Uncharacterized protein n=1 Tax=Chionoecetes opilio TaxID=41210 RepID=A0A8J4Y1V4_CHIOP|nr:hypothetical protein GWK47_001267 [Chionoecetes opilio]
MSQGRAGLPPSTHPLPPHCLFPGVTVVVGRTGCEGVAHLCQAFEAPLGWRGPAGEAGGAWDGRSLKLVITLRLNCCMVQSGWLAGWGVFATPHPPGVSVASAAEPRPTAPHTDWDSLCTKPRPVSCVALGGGSPGCHATPPSVFSSPPPGRHRKANQTEPRGRCATVCLPGGARLSVSATLISLMLQLREQLQGEGLVGVEVTAAAAVASVPPSAASAPLV